MAGRRSGLSLEEILFGRLIKERPFQWTKDLYMKMALYLSEHYKEYSAALQQGKKLQFLRIMKTRIDGLEGIEDTQIRQAFNKLLNQYELVKAKVNSGGNQPNGTSHKDTLVCFMMVVRRLLSQDRKLLEQRRGRFKWTKDVHMKMATYLSEHYDDYSDTVEEGKRMQFLRTMKTELDELEGLSDLQLQNGFFKFLNKYELVKAKLNSGGEQPDETAYKAWTLVQCPYFYILDATFARNPKDMPPCATHEPKTGDSGNEVTIESDEESSSEVSIVFDGKVTQKEIPVIDIDSVDEDNEYSECQLSSPVSPPNYIDCNLITRSPSIRIKERPFKWTRDLYLKMAKYLCEHYDEYSAALKQGKRVEFLGIMATKIDGLEDLRDRQIFYGFSKLLTHYRLVKAKVNSGGEKPDGTSHKETVINCFMTVVHRLLSQNETLSGRKRPFKWTNDVFMKVATYLSEHYDEYSDALKQGKRLEFLRLMTIKLDGLQGLDDKQIKSGFWTFLKKYELVKAKMNSGGKQPDGAVHRGILEQCPYFYILDTTFATTPIDIRHEPETGDIRNEVEIESDEESSSENPTVLTNMKVRRSSRSSLVKHKLIGRNSECFICSCHRKPFKWKRDLYMKMATYLSEHYDEYSAAITRSEKRQFLRMMRTQLDGLEGLDRIQIRQGFWNLLYNYKLVKAKVNSGGKQRDGTAHKEEIMKQCPYFYILDATFAKTPKEVPPYIEHVLETDDIGNEVTVENDEDSSSGDSIDDNVAQHKTTEIEIDSVEEDKKDGECQLSSPVSPPNYRDCNLITCSPSEASHVKNEDVNKYYECRLIRPCTVLLRNCFDCDPITRSPSVASYVRDACKDIGVGKGEKRSIDTLIELSDGKVEDQSEVEKQKLKLEEKKFAAQHAIQLKKLDIEHLKVKAKSERKAQRFAMKKAKAQQLREITKLRLQIELEKLKKLQRDTAEDN